MKTKYLIIGAGAAGMSAARSISEIDTGGSITILSNEGVKPYFRPLIPYIITGTKKLDDILLEGMGPFAKLEASILTGERVKSIDAKHKTVSTGKKMRDYDRLLLATGSRPKIPGEMEGTDTDGVYTLRFYSDAKGIASRIGTGGHAVLAGGGLLNLKAAFALRKKGINVTLVINSPAILSQLMEPDDSFLLKNAISDEGIRTLTGKNVKKIISGKSGVEGIILDNGDELPCSLVCIGKGVEPITDYLENSGINIDKGIVANEFTETNMPGIFTAGDAAVTFNPVSGEPVITGLWTNAAEMGKCAGRNMAGLETSYAGTMGILNATQLGDVPFVSMGVVHTRGTDLDSHVFSSSKTYRKLVFSSDGKRLVGALFIGNIKNAGLYRYVIKNNMPVQEIKTSILKQSLNYGHFLKTEMVS